MRFSLAGSHKAERSAILTSEYRIRFGGVLYLASVRIPIFAVSLEIMYLARSLAVMRGFVRARKSMARASDMAEELLLIERINDTTSLCVSSISRNTFASAELENLGDDRGYFIYEVDERPYVGGMQILGKAASIEAVYRLAEIWKLAISPTKSKRRAANSPSTPGSRGAPSQEPAS